MFVPAVPGGEVTVTARAVAALSAGVGITQASDSVRTALVRLLYEWGHLGADFSDGQ